MKISLEWLRTYLSLPENEEEISALLTDLGLEVEGIGAYESIPGSLQGVVVGEVLECFPHPNADRLKVTRVDIGDGASVQIVCGATNVDVGQKVPVATIGTTLHGTSGEPLQIKKGKIRGEISEGMICAEDELGLGTSHDGIMVLDGHWTPGTPAGEVFELFKDRIIEIGLTPNRSDAMSHFGVARDLRAGLQQRGWQGSLKPRGHREILVDNLQQGFTVQVDSVDKAPRYAGVLIRGLRVGPSPAWLQSRLRSLGLKPINNVVDLTNFVMHDVGQPLHAFDLSRIAGATIRVGQVPDGTPFVTLDGEERILHSEDLLICDLEKPLCIAGVYGGLHSGVSEHTTDIFLESACFDPVSIRKTARRHGLNTDASFRFERGVDAEGVYDYLCYAAGLITEVAGGTCEGPGWDLYPTPLRHVPFELGFEDIDRLVGQRIPQLAVRQILESLDIQVLGESNGVLTVQPPHYRRDVTRKVDVIEEILRVFGYNEIASSAVFSFALPPFERNTDEDLRREVSRVLASQGFSEIMTNSLVSVDSQVEERESSGAVRQVQLLNPLSSELAGLRTELCNSGLEVVRHNLNHKQHALCFFEFGHTYRLEETTYVETDVLGLWCGRAGKHAHWIARPQVSRFFELKGILESLWLKLGIALQLEQDPRPHRWGESLAYIDTRTGSLVAQLIQLSEQRLDAFDIDIPMAYAEIDWQQLLVSVQTVAPKFAEIPRFPEVYRDFSLLVDRSVPFARIHAVIEKLKIGLIQRISLFDVFEGKELGEDLKAYGIRITLLDRSKTLTDKQIEKVVTQVVQQLEKELGAKLR